MLSSLLLSVCRSRFNFLLLSACFLLVCLRNSLSLLVILIGCLLQSFVSICCQAVLVFLYFIKLRCTGSVRGHTRRTLWTSSRVSREILWIWTTTKTHVQESSPVTSQVIVLITTNVVPSRTAASPLICRLPRAKLFVRGLPKSKLQLKHWDNLTCTRLSNGVTGLGQWNN